MKPSLFRAVLLILALLPAVTASAHAGMHFRCTAESVDLRTGGWKASGGGRREVETDEQGHVLGSEFSAGLIGDSVQGRCQDRKGRHYRLEIQGIGLTARVNNEYFVVKCPLVRKKRFADEAAFAGVGVSASIIGGARVGALSNELLGVCVIGGVQLGVGASAVLQRMVFTRDE